MEKDKEKKKKNIKDKVFALGKQYIALEKLGKGTYGTVYKTQRKDLAGEFFAIKKIKIDVDSEGIPSTALREIAILKKMKHPNVVKIVDLAFSEKNIELCLEYCHYDLKKFMEKYKTDPSIYNVQMIKTIMYQILKSTDFLHSRKILHRDLKPQNVLVCESTLLTKLADFGLSRVYSIPIRPYTKEVLTLWYRAPELMLGLNHYSTGLDMWSIGCIFAELFLKKPLFPGDSEIDQLYRIFRVFGSFNESMLPGYKLFPDYNASFPVWAGIGLNKYIRDNMEVPLDSEGFELLEKMMVIDPCKRISCKEALMHVYIIYFLLIIHSLSFKMWFSHWIMVDLDYKIFCDFIYVHVLIILKQNIL